MFIPRGISLFILSAALLLNAAAAQTIDAGRGPVPLRVPSGYDEANPAPLVVLLHGYTLSGKGQESYMKFGEIADEFGYLFMAPDGTKEESERGSRFWNASTACCNFFGSTVDDSGYIRGLIDKVKSQYKVDAKRVYLVGHSNGGFMSYRVAYDHPEIIAAFASLAGATLLDPDRPAPASPVHALQIHGTKDSTIKYEGGEFGGGSPYPSAVESVEQWARYNGCAINATIAEGNLDLDRRLEGRETAITRYTNLCKVGGSAELWSIAGGSHIPALSDTFARSVIEWLFAHPKP